MKYSGSLTLGLALIVGCFAMSSSATAADAPLRLSGAATLGKEIRQKQADIEAKSGVSIVATPNGTGRGLEDLATGRADIAMIGGPLAAAVDEYNKKSQQPLASDTLKQILVHEMPISVIANPANKVDSITLEQLRDILAGKIANWKELGGNDQDIVVALPPMTDGVTVTLKYEVLHEMNFVANARMVQQSSDVNKVVAQVPGAIAYLTTFNKARDVKALTLDKPITIKLSLVTKGEPAGQTKSVVDAVCAVIGDRK